MNLAQLHYIGKMIMESAIEGMSMVGSTGFSATELIVIESLIALGAASIGEISRRTGFAQSRISTVVADLHHRGVVEVETDARDRRRTIVDVSDAALAKVERASTADAEPALASRFPELPPDQLHQLVDALREAVEKLSPSAEYRDYVDAPQRAYALNGQG